MSLSDKRVIPVPPKGTSNIGLGVTEVPMGWDIEVIIRTLTKDEPVYPPQIRPYIVLWTHVSQLLRKSGFDLENAVEHLPEPTKGGLL